MDFLVEFREDLPSRFDAYFGLKESLEALLGRSVDLVAPVALRCATDRRLPNVLVHGYAVIDNELVWEVCTTRAPDLAAELGRLPHNGAGE